MQQIISEANAVEPWAGFLTAKAGAQELVDPAAFEGKRILVTGAGGYIGSALARSLALLPVAQLVLLDIAEHGLFTLDRQLESASHQRKHALIVGSVHHEALIHEIFEEHRPQVIFHAAAHKHVALMELNPFAAVETNALGTRTVVRAAARFQAEQFLLLSTDKAVDPISIMGATKRLAELMVLAGAGSTPIKALRLCNVLGSSGSVAPLFWQQIQEGRAVTVTDAAATRYFLSIADTVQALAALAAADLAPGLYIPKVRQPYRIDDLAQFLITASPGKTPRSQVEYTGLPAADKLHEKLVTDREKIVPAASLFRVDGSAIERDTLSETLALVETAVNNRNLSQLLNAICSMVPEYKVSASLAEQAARSAR